MTSFSRCASVLALALAGTGWCWAAPASTTPEGCNALTRHGRRAEAITCYEELSRSGVAYLRAEGFWGLAQYDQANEMFRVAVAQPGSKAIYRVRWGLLLHERFNNKEAVDLFNEALQQDPANAQAYLGLALVSADGFDSNASEYAAKALTLDPKLVEAHELMANLALEDAKTQEAVAEADKAIALSNEALAAMAARAAVEVLADRTSESDAWFANISAVNPSYGEGYALVGHHLVLHMRYEEGVAY